MNTPSEPKKSNQSPDFEINVIPFKSEVPVPAKTATDLDDLSPGDEIYGLAVKFFDWDWKPVVSRKAAWKRKRRVEVPVSKFSFETGSYDEARRLVEDHFRDLNHESHFEEHDLPRAEKAALIEKFDDAFTGLALDALESRWAEPELADD